MDSILLDHQEMDKILKIIENSGIFNLSNEDDREALESIRKALTAYCKSQENILIADMFDHCCRMIATDKLFGWNGYKYDKNVQTILLRACETVFRQLNWQYKTSIGAEVIKLLLNRHCLTDPTILNNNPDIIAFKNCYLRISTGEIIEPDPELYVISAFDFNYTPNDKCPQFRKFMKEILPNESSRRIVLIFLAYAMTTSVRLQKSLMMYGEGNNGKTQLLDLVKYIWGELAVDVTLQMLNENPWRMSLRGALIASDPDISPTRMEDSGWYKKIVTERKISAEIYIGLQRSGLIQLSSFTGAINYPSPLMMRDLPSGAGGFSCILLKPL